MLRKTLFVLLLGVLPNAHVSATECLTTDNYVESEGLVCESGKNMAITSAAEMLIPKDWKMRFLEEEVQMQVVSWPKGKLWADTLDLIGRTSNIGFLVDGHKKVVIALRPTDNVKPGSVVINSRIARTRQFLGLEEIYARVDDTERARREKLARKKSTVVPHRQLNAKGVQQSRLSYVNVEDAVFVTTLKQGDLESRLKDFFLTRWGYTLVLNKRGFYSNPTLDEEIKLKGTSIVDDAKTLQNLLNSNAGYIHNFSVYNGNKVIELTITCGVCGYE